jgi:hypothetical protein
VALSQIYKVSGLGDTQPMEHTAATNEINRRVSVLLKIQEGSRIGGNATNSVRALNRS